MPHGPGIDCNLIPSRGTGSGSLVWVVGPVVAGIAMATVVVLVIVFRRRAQPLKQPMDGGQVADLKQVYSKASYLDSMAKCLDLNALI